MVIDPERSASGDASHAHRATDVRCPRCGEGTLWHGNSDRPFCSLRCRLIDLGLWLDERHRIEAEGDGDAARHDVS